VVVVGWSCRAYVSELRPPDAVSIAVCAAVTTEARAVKLALDAPLGTVTDAGTATALLLLDSVTMNPADPAASVSVTVQPSVADPVSDPLLHLNALNSRNPL
jgi:hypothetical protein